MPGKLKSTQKAGWGSATQGQTEDGLYFAGAPAENLCGLGQTLSPGPMRSAPRQRFPTSGGYHTLRTVYRREGEQSHARTVSEIPHPTDFAALAQPVLEGEIRSTGFFRNKSKNIIGMAKKLVADFGGQVPRTMEEMLTLPGVARKTANVVLGTAYGIPTGVVVDTHVFRIAHRLKLSIGRRRKKLNRT